MGQFADWHMVDFVAEVEALGTDFRMGWRIRGVGGESGVLGSGLWMSGKGLRPFTSAGRVLDRLLPGFPSSKSGRDGNRGSSGRVGTLLETLTGLLI